MKTKRIVAGVFIILLGGCVPSLHELYTDDTLVFDNALLGKWEHDKELWQFDEAADGKSYNLVITQDEKQKNVLVGHLVKIEKHLFLDLYPGDMDLNVGDWYKLHLLPVHTFLKVDAVKPTIVLRAMDPETFEKMVEEKPELIKHEVIEDRVVLTASTKELQAFVKKHADIEGFFGDEFELSRYVPPVQNEAEAVGGDNSQEND